MGPPSPSGALPPAVIGRRSTSIDFAENQLFPSLIGLSPLATAHPRLFQQAWVRSSSGCYPTFNLAMARSLGFGSSAGNSSALIRLAFAAPTPLGLSLLPTETRGPIIQKVRRHTSRVLRLLVGARFQVSFTPLVGVLFTFPSRYLCTIGRQGVFRLGGWSPHVQTGFHVPRPTRGSCQTLRLRGYHPLWPAFRDRSASSRTITGLLRFRSPLLAESLLMSFPPGTEMFQFPGFASSTYEFSAGSPMREGFPHSDIRGSTIARISPRLFAACHVLHRLLAPRHPPNALCSLYLSPATARAQNQGAPDKRRAVHRGTRSVTHTRSLDNLLSRTRRPVPVRAAHTSPHKGHACLALPGRFDVPDPIHPVKDHRSPVPPSPRPPVQAARLRAGTV